ncbi:uncharacterized protein B0T23DRAFT_126447 [Neurospora hispaniola]|uniref:Uncharacterized protein n=1 Tax=Neurospora hispaniola TaxID=588809 RepID=A0AAJ0IAP4_9PEZI|nr:hypothetical protein B0T23DRAFT_126447 [Neurospora hispaniola]
MRDISSLSSGFGDSKIFVPEQNLSLNNQPPQSTPLRPTTLRTDPRGYQHSEDTPARSPSLNSWVAQQSGRVRREQELDKASYLASLPQLPCQPGVTGIHNPSVK